ncbi:MAG: RNA polymerase sporulation sigma factor SigE, partial [Christensenellales bacterium]
MRTWIRRIQLFFRRLLARLGVVPRVDYIGSAVPLPPPLTHEQERALVTALENGDTSARGTLIEHNLRLVVY